MEDEKLPFRKGGKPGPGRPKGCANKTTQTAMEAIALAAEALGGHKRLGEWAKEAAEVAWQAQMNRELEHASIVDLVEVRNVPCPPGTLPLGTSVKGAGNVTVVDPDHYA